MQIDFQNRKYIEKFICRDLPEPEIKRFFDALNEDRKLFKLVEICELELIERYLTGDLQGTLLEKIEARKRTDKKFNEYVKFSRRLGNAAKDIEKWQEFRDRLEKSK